MAEQCRYFEYRTEADRLEFDVARTYCTAVDKFVQLMRADVRNRRYDFEQSTDCKFYAAAEADEAGETR